jgi:hypothetical protein
MYGSMIRWKGKIMQEERVKSYTYVALTLDTLALKALYMHETPWGPVSIIHPYTLTPKPDPRM